MGKRGPTKQEEPFEMTLSIDFDAELIDAIIGVTKPIFDRRGILSSGHQSGAGSAEYFFEVEEKNAESIYREITEKLYRAGITRGWRFLH